MTIAEIWHALHPITQLFVVVILALAIYVHWSRFTVTTINHGPTIFTTIGIFATFFGIAWGLKDFDAAHVQESVPSLLNGIKTAFFASVVGVGAALTIKFRAIVYGPVARPATADIEGATMDDLATLLKGIQRSLAGNEESTLVSQMKLSRQDSNDRLDTIKRSMQEYLEKMAENNSKALIEALKEVIKDFNAKINEQFGENFKQLNAAVEKILIWQEKYREQMTEMIAQQEQSAKNMAIATERYTEVVAKAEVFNKVSQQFSVLLEALETQRNRIQESLTALGKLFESASRGIPEIEGKIIEMTKQVGAGVKVNSDEMIKAVKAISIAFEAAHAEQNKMFGATIKTANQDFNAQIKQITDKTKEQVAALDAALSKELTDALQIFGKQLAALSQKFAEDYSPLTDKLRNILDSIKRV